MSSSERVTFSLHDVQNLLFPQIFPTIIDCWHSRTVFTGKRRTGPDLSCWSAMYEYKHSVCRRAVFVRPSVTFVYCVVTSKHILILFFTVMNRFRTEQGHCGACRRKWRLTDTDLCPSGETQTMSHVVESCPLTKLNNGLSRLHSADEDAVSWLTSYGSWHTYEKKKIVKKISKTVILFVSVKLEVKLSPLSQSAVLTLFFVVPSHLDGNH